jgi:hypothetical protein
MRSGARASRIVDSRSVEILDTVQRPEQTSLPALPALEDSTPAEAPLQFTASVTLKLGTSAVSPANEKSRFG